MNVFDDELFQMGVALSAARQLAKCREVERFEAFKRTMTKLTEQARDSTIVEGTIVEGIACASQCLHDIQQHTQREIDRLQSQTVSLTYLHELEERVIDAAAKLGVIVKLKESATERMRRLL